VLRFLLLRAWVFRARRVAEPARPAAIGEPAA
jgi:hypothetical protein